jgi:hypothetical protein
MVHFYRGYGTDLIREKTNLVEFIRHHPIEKMEIQEAAKEAMKECRARFLEEYEEETRLYKQQPPSTTVMPPYLQNNCRTDEDEEGEEEETLYPIGSSSTRTHTTGIIRNHPKHKMARR